MSLTDLTAKKAFVPKSTPRVLGLSRQARAASHSRSMVCGWGAVIRKEQRLQACFSSNRRPKYVLMISSGSMVSAFLICSGVPAIVGHASLDHQGKLESTHATTFKSFNGKSLSSFSKLFYNTQWTKPNDVLSSCVISTALQESDTRPRLLKCCWFDRGRIE